MTPQILIQCAGDKSSDAGTFKYHGKIVNFVAQPQVCQETSCSVYVNPNQIIDQNKNITWFDKLKEYNKEYVETGDNPYNLFKAVELYRNAIFNHIKQRIGSENIYILSAGWGIVKGSYLLPDYNITFSGAHNNKEWRDINLEWQDMNHLDDPPSNINDLHIFCTANYHPLLKRLLGGKIRKDAKITIHTNLYMDVDNYKYEEFFPTGNTNWQYACAKDFINNLD